MGWARVTDRETGEVHYSTTPEAYDQAAFDVLPIVDDRCPVALEDVDSAGNILVSVERKRSALWEQVKAIRSARKNGLAATPVGIVQIDQESKLNITGALSLCRLQEELGQAFSLNFTLADNSRVALDSITVRQLAGAVGAFVSALYDHSAGLRDALDAAATSADLDAIDIETGWP